MQSDVMQSASFYKAWAWFEANKKQVFRAAAIAVVAGLILWFFLWRQGEKEVDASEALSNVALPQATGPGQRPESASAYLQIAQKYPKSSAGARALLLAGGSLFVDGKYSEARTQFERFTREHRESPFLGQALMGIAACLEAEGKTTEATAAYKSLVERHPNENVVPQARFALGRLYEAQNKPEEARKQFEEVTRSDPYGSLGNESGMRLEELKGKYPTAFPVVPMPTNSINLTP